MYLNILFSYVCEEDGEANNFLDNDDLRASAWCGIMHLYGSNPDIINQSEFSILNCITKESNDRIIKMLEPIYNRLINQLFQIFNVLLIYIYFSERIYLDEINIKILAHPMRNNDGKAAASNKS